MTREFTVPTVSVVTPSLNRDGTIEACLDSVAAQTGLQVEHLVVDGGSTDGTVGILRSRACPFVSEPDPGLYAAINKGIRSTRGRFVHVLAADDRFVRPDALISLVSEMETKGLDVCHARLNIVGPRGKTPFGRSQNFDGLLRNMLVAHPTMLVRRTVYEQFGLYSEGFRIAGDYEFALRVWPHVRTGFLDELLVEMAEGGMSSTPANRPRLAREAMAASLLHGASPCFEAIRWYYRRLSSRLRLGR